jgi:protein TonB
MKTFFTTVAFLVIFSIAKAQQQPTDSTSIKITGVIMHPGPVDTVKIYQVVALEPSFPGGPRKWLEYIKANLKYPEAAKADKAEGRVFVTFVVERDGSVTNPKILRGIGNGCDEEAQRLLKNSPKWNPGMQNGHTVRVQYIVPVEFKL